VIPTAFLQAWSAKAPWPDLRQVEQDLIICRALCDLFNAPALRGRIAFRGGTAIHKLLFKAPLRYSEDIDLVQLNAEPIGETVDAVRDALSWLGKCNREQAGHSMHMIFRFTAEVDAQATLKLKVEINTREHASLLGIRGYPFAVENDWYRGKAEIASFESEELFGTKLRALLQRRRNRDLFDLHEGLEQLHLAPEKLIACFDHYLALEAANHPGDGRATHAGKVDAKPDRRRLAHAASGCALDRCGRDPCIRARLDGVDREDRWGRMEARRCRDRGITRKAVPGAADAA
jgi:predicted nucleotidyltransferase component of viral defense system